jgi:hypothetical protein
MKFLLNFPLVTVLGKYETDGRILLLPIKGNGNVNITDGEKPDTRYSSLVASVGHVPHH